MLLAQASPQAVNVTAIIVALIGTAGAVLSYIQATQVRRQQRRQSSREVEAEAYERARKFDMETVDSIRKEAERLRGLLQEEQASNRDLRNQVTSLSNIESQLSDFRHSLDTEKETSQNLRQQVARLEARIREIREHLSAYLEGRADRAALESLIVRTENLLTDGPNGSDGGN